MESERLRYRLFEKGDGAHIIALDSNIEVLKYLHQEPLNDLNEAEKIVEGVLNQYEKNGIGRWWAIEKESNQVIGWTGIKYETMFRDFPYYDIGYRYIPKFWRKGYGFEAALFWRDYAFSEMNIEKLNATAHVDNVGSNKILQKIGMEITDNLEYGGDQCNWYELNKTQLGI